MAEPLAARLTMPDLEHPLVRYANAVKHRRPIREEDFAFHRAVDGSAIAFGAVGVALAAKNQGPRPPDWRIVELMNDLFNQCVRADNILPLFVEMLAVERGSSRAEELCTAMAKVRPSELAMIQASWTRLVKKRVGLLKRIKTALF